VPAEVTNLAQVRRERADERREALPLVVESERGAVRLVIGAGEDEVELAVSPDLADEIGDEIKRAAREARRRG
jgi:hypothetical protein